MGSWFSNLHIRKNSVLTVTAVVEYIRKQMESKQYLPAASEEEADGAFAIVHDSNTQWFSVYSDLFSFDDPSQFANYAVPMSKALETDILGISCFDSDYLYLNLIDAANNVDAWVGVGSAAGLGIRRRTNLSAWKNKVQDFSGFKERVKQPYDFAEDVLSEIEHCIHLPQEQGAASYEYLSDFGLHEQAVFLYFKLPEAMKTQEAPKLVPYTPSLMPCFLDRPSLVEGINVGGASRGLSVYFLGPYVEKEEITFPDVCFVQWKNNQTISIPFKLKKIQLADGQWAYYHHDPGYKILPKVDDQLPMMKRMQTESKHCITVRFVPQGDPRKVLDITVMLVPDQNPEGRTTWNVWHQFGSKKAFIQYHNTNWSRFPNGTALLMREEDYD